MCEFQAKLLVIHDPGNAIIILTDKCRFVFYSYF